MSHKELVKVLRECPASDYFGQSKVNLNERTLSVQKARIFVDQMVRRTNIQMVERISEEEKGESSYSSSLSNGR